MKKMYVLMALVAMSVLSVRAEVKYLTTAEFKEKIVDYQKDSVWTYKGNKPVGIDFYTTWCCPCKRLAPIMEELSEKYKGKIEFYKVDTERERELAYVFNISSIPQVLYVPTKGKPQLTKGLYPKEEIEKIIDQFLLKKK